MENVFPILERLLQETLFEYQVQSYIAKQNNMTPEAKFDTRGVEVFPYSLGGGVPLGSRKSYPLLDQILQIL